VELSGRVTIRDSRETIFSLLPDWMVKNEAAITHTGLPRAKSRNVLQRSEAARVNIRPM